jgi:acyl dehydratase
MANKYVTDEVRKQIGMQSEARVVEVERGAIRRFAEAIGDPNPLFNDEAAARRTRFGGMIAPPTFGEFRGLDGGSEWEYFEPIRPGDRISVVSKIADIRESAGRLGAMVFITVETSYTNHYNQLCAVQRSTVIRY